MAYTLGNKYAKHLCKRIVLLQIIIENVVTCFFGTQCSFCKPNVIAILRRDPLTGVSNAGWVGKTPELVRAVILN